MPLTPPGTYSEQIVVWGLLAVFAGLPVYILVGVVFGRIKGFEAGAGTTMVLFGLAGLGSAAWLANYVYAESMVVVLPSTGCEPLQPGLETPRSRDLFELQRPAGAAPLRLVTPAQERLCPQQKEPPSRLRIRRDEVAAGAPLVLAEREEDKRHPVGLIGMFIAFGGFGLLGGLALSATAVRHGRKARGKAPPPTKPVGPMRQQAAEVLSTAGTLAGLGGLVSAAFFDSDAASFSAAFNGPALACLCYFISFVVTGKLTVVSASVLLLVGGGCALAAAAVRYFA